MSKIGCTCGHVIRDNTDFLPYKTYIREDEDTEKPIELLATVLARFWEAREQQRESAFIRDLFISRGEAVSGAEWYVEYLKGKPLPEVLFSLILPFWNHYDRVIYECEECGRLWVEVEEKANEFVGITYVPYAPETDTRHVLWSRHHHNPDWGKADE
jgi:hypothetical protein